MTSSATWQYGEPARLRTALLLVFRQLDACALLVVAATCRAWRHAAGDGAAWRAALRARLLAAGLSPAGAERRLHALRTHTGTPAAPLLS